MIRILIDLSASVIEPLLRPPRVFNERFAATGVLCVHYAKSCPERMRMFSKIFGTSGNVLKVAHSCLFQMMNPFWFPNERPRCVEFAD